MLTELNEAIKNKERYKFLVCKGTSDNYDSWFFEEFDVDKFMEYCALTTPILRYAYHPNPEKQPEFRKDTTKANEELIKLMYQNFQEWKTDVENAEEITECTEYINEYFENEILEANNEEVFENQNIECFYKKGQTEFFKKGDEKFVYKYSKKQNHANVEYWYGITEVLLERMREKELTHIILETEKDGSFKLPIHILEDYIGIANYSDKPDGKVFHIYIKRENDGLKLFKSGEYEFLLNNYALE